VSLTACDSADPNIISPVCLLVNFPYRAEESPQGGAAGQNEAGR